MSDQLSHLVPLMPHLKERAQGWPTHRRLRKVQEECAELIAAINRYLENPSAFLREKMAEEFLGVEITTGNVVDEFVGEIESARPRQLLRFKGALERDGL